MAADNMSLGRFRLEGIPQAIRGMPQVEVTFDIDANGILKVSARDQATGKEQNVTITASTNLSKNEIDRMVRDARDHETDDRRQKELVEARNTADNMAYQTEKALRELGERLPESERRIIQDKVEALRQANQGQDVAQIKRLSGELENALHALNQQASAQQPAQPSGNGGQHNAGGQDGSDEGEVVEGQFRDL
jgi:molecular chaperone DnaK